MGHGRAPDKADGGGTDAASAAEQGCAAWFLSPGTMTGAQQDADGMGDGRWIMVDG